MTADPELAVASAVSSNGVATPKEKICFLACPIGAVGSETRERSDRVMTYVIEEALTPLGYKTVRADRINSAGRITTQIVTNIIEADLLIADLTDQNANVFYELAIRHAFDKPYVQLIEDGQVIPFDVRDMRTLHLDYRDLASAAKAKTDLTEMVRDIESGNKPESPVVTAVDLRTLEQSGDPNKIETAQLAAALQTLNSEISSLREERRSPKNMAATDKKIVDMRRELTQSYEAQLAMARLIRDLSDKRTVTSMDIERVVNLATHGDVGEILARVAADTPPF
ncbi:hypothetical protein [Mycobacterium sp. D16Q16]|uniref:hypothetical protein n=1 Tax=Mycobacterium sp. D16Q16 TaxID=1855659 RepID=UPI0011169EF0|nr:hypothetical protein [Mycobacterium sp. D16Q16]